MERGRVISHVRVRDIALIVGIILVLGFLVLIVPKESRKIGLNPEITLVSETMVGDIYERVYEVRAERQLTPHELYSLVGNFIYEFENENPNFSVITESVGAQVGEPSRFWFRYKIV